MWKVVGWFTLFISMAVIEATSLALAQPYPSKPVRLISTQAVGGVTGTTARIFADGLNKTLGQPVVLDPKPGADGVVAYQYVAQMPPDGYTLGWTSNVFSTMQAFGSKDLPFDLKDLVPVSVLIESVIYFVSPAQAPWNTFQEMVAYAKANLGKINFGSPGMRTPASFVMALMNETFGIDIVNVPYKSGTAQARPALLANDIQLTNYVESMVTADGNRVKVVAVSGNKRQEAFPQVPSLAELGMPDLKGAWFALLVRAGTPKAIVDRIYEASKDALQLPEIKQALANGRLDVITLTPEASAKFIAEETATYSDLLKKGALKVQ